MDRDFETIAREAEQLDPQKRYQLAERLMRNLPPSKEHREAWLAESQRRADAVDRGEMELIEGEEALAALRKLLGKK